MLRFIVFFILLLCAGADRLLAQSGFVRSGGQPIPGATVTIKQGGQTLSTVTDNDGHYAFPPIAAGTWTATVEIFGFEPLLKNIDYAS